MSDFKTIEPKPGVIIMPIIVPEAYHDCTFKMFTDNELMVIYPSESYDSFCALPEGNWIPLGISTELTEEQCAELVETSEYYDPHQQPYATPCYKGYIDNYWKLTAKESFASFMQANQLYTVNPYPNPDTTSVLGSNPSGGDYEVLDFIRENWQEAEANTGKYLILKLVE